MLFEKTIDKAQARLVPMRILAHLGDAVFSLFEREKIVLQMQSASGMHNKIATRVSARKQAEILNGLMPHLSSDEQEIIRMARNLKLTGRRSSNQLIYRQSTAFEALIGYLYLTSHERLKYILDQSLF